MQSVLKIAMVPLAVILLSLSTSASYHSSAKLRRDGVLNLYPFPRVGRASQRTWQVPIDDFYLEYEPIEKRQLYAFPRVGRGDLTPFRGPLHRGFQSIPVKRNTADTPGMWFGPRLGRSFKSDDDDITVQNEPERSEPEQVEREKRNTETN